MEPLLQTIWYWHKIRYIDQQKRIEIPEINLFIYGQIIDDKGAKNIQKKKTVSSINGAEKTVQSEVAQLCPTLCDAMDCSLPGSSVHGISQAIELEWIAISFSRGGIWISS